MEDKKKDMTLEQVREEEKKEEVREILDEQLEGIAGGTTPTIRPW